MIPRILIVLLVLVAGNIAAHQLADALDFQIRPINEDRVHAAVMISAALYVLLLAIPFVPGAEVGIALIATLGPPIAFLVYVCTVAGLTLSFVIGRLLPTRRLIRATRELRLHRISKLLEQVEPLDRAGRLAFLTQAVPGRSLPFVLRFRYLALALVLNVPGNVVIGGGGGIALLAGVSRLFSAPGFLATVVVAVSPVPLAVLSFGSEFLSR